MEMEIETEALKKMIRGLILHLTRRGLMEVPKPGAPRVRPWVIGLRPPGQSACGLNVSPEAAPEALKFLREHYPDWIAPQWRNVK
jgi:hypothetical protein